MKGKDFRRPHGRYFGRIRARGGGEPGWVRQGDTWKFYGHGAIAARQDRWAEEDARLLDPDDELLGPDEEYSDEIPMPYMRETEKSAAMTLAPAAAAAAAARNTRSAACPGNRREADYRHLRVRHGKLGVHTE